MALTFYRDALVRFNGNRVSDHNRSNVDRSPERIGNSVRTARGALRKNHVADKLSFSMSWATLPEKDDHTVDGFWGAESLIEFFNNTTGEFTLTLENSDGSSSIYTVVFTDFDYSVVHRFQKYYYDISLSVEEV